MSAYAAGDRVAMHPLAEGQIAQFLVKQGAVGIVSKADDQVAVVKWPYHGTGIHPLAHIVPVIARVDRIDGTRADVRITAATADILP